MFCAPSAAPTGWSSSSAARACAPLAIHGDLRQGAREKALADFMAGKVTVLVATDVAARGIHVDDVDVVIHYDPPEDEKAYLHRSGRTARAGESGVAVTLMLWNQENEIRRDPAAPRPRRSRWSRSSPTTPAWLDLPNFSATASSPTPDLRSGVLVCRYGDTGHAKSMGTAAGSTRDHGRHEPHLPPHRRHHRVRHPGRRRQGQGAEGRGRERHRLRRRRARLPDARAHRRGRGRGRARDPRNHHYSPTPGLPELREAIADKTKRDSGVDGRRRARSSSPTAASTRSTTRSRCCCDPGDEVLSPRRTGRRIPRRSRSPAACRSGAPDDRGGRVPGHGRAARSGAHAAHEGAAVRVAEQPDRRGVPARRGRGDRALGASSTASGSSPTRSTSTSPTAATCSRRCRRSCPSSPSSASCSTASPRPTR